MIDNYTDNLDENDRYTYDENTLNIITPAVQANIPVVELK